MAQKYEYDLETRTADFAKRIVRMCKELPRNEINRPLRGREIFYIK